MTEHDYKYILRCVVGSRAHGLSTPNSDWDFRGVFVVPTRDILTIGGTIEETHWIEGKDDDTSWEVKHFLELATHCNPTILETFLAPLAPGSVIDNFGLELQNLFPYVWNSVDVKNAFIGYGFNQRKKFLEDKDNRPHKYAAAYLRILYNAYELLSTGTFNVELTKTPIYETVKRFKNGDYKRGEVIDECYFWQTKVEEAFRQNPDRKANLEPVNEFLLKIRKEFWE